MARSKADRHGGFTLIELLVVISIIAILMAIMMPVLGKVRKQARFIICRTNVKTLMLAGTFYADANNRKMPPYGLNKGLWINKISKYIDNMDKARYCPSAKTWDKDAAARAKKYIWGSAHKSWMWNMGTRGPEYGSYSINGWLYTGQGKNDEKHFKSLSEVKYPSLTPMFADAIWVDAWPKDTDTCPSNFNLDGNKNNGGKMSMFIINRHDDRINVSFVDGHLGDIKLEKLWSLKWYNNFKTIPKMTRDGSMPIYQK